MFVVLNTKNIVRVLIFFEFFVYLYIVYQIVILQAMLILSGANWMANIFCFVIFLVVTGVMVVLAEFWEAVKNIEGGRH